MAKCDECGGNISTEEKNNHSGMCEDCWDELVRHEIGCDSDLEGTGHGDISHNDSDPVL